MAILEMVNGGFTVLHSIKSEDLETLGNVNGNNNGHKTNDNQNMSQQVHRGESERRKHDASSATGNTARGWNNWRRSWLAVFEKLHHKSVSCGLNQEVFNLRLRPPEGEQAKVVTKSTVFKCVGKILQMGKFKGFE